MAVESSGKVWSKDMKTEDLNEFSNIFASEFNNSDIHDRVLCFQVIIEDEEYEMNVDSEPESQSETAELPGSDRFGDVQMVSSLPKLPDLHEDEDEVKIYEKREADDDIEKITAESEEKQDTIVVREASELKLHGDQDQNNIIEEEQKLQNQTNQTEQNQENSIKNQNEEVESSNEDDENKTNKIIDDEKKFPDRKLFVHSQWLSVQSPYFRALFYSGMKETYSKEVVMKIYEHELEAHLILIEAMYKLNVLNEKSYCLIVQVLILAHKYDVSLVIKKCKYVLMATAPSLEMCEYILQKTDHLNDMADVNDMLLTFLVKEFSPIDKTWTTEKFIGLSKAALRLLLKSDDLSTHSENTIFVALMKWVQLNVPDEVRNKCELLDVVRFELMSLDFLYDVVQDHVIAFRMPGFTKYLLNGLAYHGFSDIRREQFNLEVKKRPSVKDAGPTFSWAVDDELAQKLTKCPGVTVYSDIFWHQGYQMQLQLKYLDDSTKCGFFFAVRNLAEKACVYASYRAKSTFFVNRVEIEKRLFTANEPDWGYGKLACNKSLRGKGYIIDIWVEVHG